LKLFCGCSFPAQPFDVNHGFPPLGQVLSWHGRESTAHQAHGINGSARRGNANGRLFSLKKQHIDAVGTIVLLQLSVGQTEKARTQAAQRTEACKAKLMQADS
jgi:hypothetical protein